MAGGCLVAAAALSQVPGPGGPPPPGMPPMPSMAETRYATALAIADGKVVNRDRSTLSGRTQDTHAAKIRIRSSQPNFNAVTVTGGRTAFTLSNAVVRLAGPGSNDFLGIGAGVLVRDNAMAVLDHVDIETSARVSSAAVAAEGATLRIYDSNLVAHGGPLPPDYTPRIGPGMLEPPAPLGLAGTARTLLAMSNSRTFIYHTHIEADGWGALSTDAAGGHLYLEANDCTVRVKGAGYGTYADFGSTVVLNRTQVDSGAYQGIIAGAARMEFNQVHGHAARSAVMIHSVMAFDVTESSQLAVRGSRLQSEGPVFLVKSANAEIEVEGGALASSTGVLLEVRKNDDPNATQTRGISVPGVKLKLKSGEYQGDVTDTDPDRGTTLSLRGVRLTGALTNVTLNADGTSHWMARSDSRVLMGADTPISVIDAPTGVTIRVEAASLSAGERPLPSGGRLLIVRP